MNRNIGCLTHIWTKNIDVTIANNEVLDKIVSVRGRIRLSHLKYKARLGNASTLDRVDYA